MLEYINAIDRQSSKLYEEHGNPRHLEIARLAASMRALVEIIDLEELDDLITPKASLPQGR